jgi:formate hydrogenlyase subunit 6/NADH:ubiquinone oxidoreductase subunit I
MYQVNSEECLCCGICVESCNQKAISFGKDGACINRELCIECGQCYEVCPADAISKD